MLWSLESDNDLERKKALGDELVVVRMERQRLLDLDKGKEFANESASAVKKEKGGETTKAVAVSIQ